MARRRSRRKFPLIRLALICVAMTVLVLVCQRAYYFLRSDRGRAWVMVKLHQDRTPRADELLTRAVRGALRVVGATDRELKPAMDSDACIRWNLELPPTVSLTQANYAVTSAVEESGGRILDAQESSGPSRDTLELRFGLSHETTHRVVLIEPHRQGPPEARARMALLIEDTEPSADALLSSYLRLGEPLSFGVLPAEGARRHSDAIAAAHSEVLLYLPMEGKLDPTSRSMREAVLVDMRPEQIRRSVQMHLAEVQHVAGIVNYQGQLATQDPAVMRTVLKEARRRGLYFVDAGTAGQSAARNAAVEVGAQCLEATVRLDAGGSSAAALGARLEEAAQRALAGVGVVAMGRMSPQLLEVLQAELPKLRARGIEVVRASDIARLGD